MNKLKKIILIIAMTLFVTNTMVAKVNVDMAMNYQSTSEDEKGKVTANEYPFSVVFLPSFSKGSFFLELRAPFSFGINNNSISFDNSYYLIPEKETGESEFSFITKNLTYYLSFINYIKYGYDWNDFNFTFGTIRNATIGDGAIIYHYRDSDFVAYERKSGLKFKLDGNLINLGYVGIEGISNDLFNSDFYGGRVFVRPFYKSSSMLSETQLGLTVINYNSVNSPSVDVQYQSLALDVNQLLYKNDNNSISFYYDLISEINTVDTSNFEDKKSIGWRVGLNGRYLSKMNYNIYFKSITDPTVDNKGVDLGENLVQLISVGGIPTINGNFSIYGTTGIYSANDNNYLLGYSEFDYENYRLKKYKLGLKYKSNSSFFMLKNLKLETYKTFVRENSSAEMKETFFESVKSLKNIELSIQSDVQYGINVFNIGLLIESDNTGKFSKKYKISYRISLF